MQKTNSRKSDFGDHPYYARDLFTIFLHRKVQKRIPKIWSKLAIPDSGDCAFIFETHFRSSNICIQGREVVALKNKYYSLYHSFLILSTRKTPIRGRLYITQNVFFEMFDSLKEFSLKKSYYILNFLVYFRMLEATQWIMYTTQLEMLYL